MLENPLCGNVVTDIHGVDFDVGILGCLVGTVASREGQDEAGPRLREEPFAIIVRCPNLTTQNQMMSMGSGADRRRTLAPDNRQ